MSEYEPAINEVQVPVLNRELCNSWLEHKDLNVTEGMICAGYPEGGKDACQVCIWHEAIVFFYVITIITDRFNCRVILVVLCYAKIPKINSDGL